MVDKALSDRSPLFEQIYCNTGRPSVAPEQLLRTLLLQVLYSICAGGHSTPRLTLRGAPKAPQLTVAWLDTGDTP